MLCCSNELTHKETNLIFSIKFYKSLFISFMVDGLHYTNTRQKSDYFATLVSHQRQLSDKGCRSNWHLNCFIAKSPEARPSRKFERPGFFRFSAIIRIQSDEKG